MSNISRGGDIAPLNKAGVSGVFTFDPIKVSCDENGLTQWTVDEKSKDRYVFHILDLEDYQSAMTKAMKSLLTALP